MLPRKKCPVCGNLFIPKKRKQICCSDACSRENRKKYYTCEHCGQQFWRPNAFRMKYCSEECQRQAFALEHPKMEKPLPTVYTRECAWCGEPFETTSSNRIYCGDDCCYEANKYQHRAQWAEEFTPRTFICKECGTEFTTKCGSPRSVFCCQSCADKYEHRKEHATERHRNYMRGQKAQRLQRLQENFVEDVSYDAVFKRDRGICGICGLPVIYDKQADNNWSGTIDHIEPLSCGGEHSMDNCQLAHRICNSLKCTESRNFSIDWFVKAEESNYWMRKIQMYQSRLAPSESLRL